MKKTFLLTIALGLNTMALNAAEVNAKLLTFTDDVKTIAASNQEALGAWFDETTAYSVANSNHVATEAIQRKFVGKRAHNTRRFSGVDKEKEVYDENTEWQGATKKTKEGPNPDHAERLNRLFRSRRGYRQ